MNTLIVNGSGAIGSAIVNELSNSDANLIITSSSGEKVHGHDSIEWRYNGSSSVDELFSIIKGKYESIDSVVNCLGSIFLKPAHLTKEEDLDATIDINLKSSFFILKNTIPLMRKNGGSILFFSSAAANIGLANHEAIAAAKAGVEGLVRSAAATYSKNNIRVNAIALGLVESNLSKSIFSNDTSLEISRKMHSIGRVGTPQNVSKFVIPLIADKSSWVTGSVINIDGGLSTTKIAS